ncbi:MAG: RNase adapter RapZ [Candidatus Nanopelagicales bacterium]
MEKNQILLVTGMSGAGRSTAARALEDVGWFVIDNLPPRLIPEAVEDSLNISSHVAIVVDVRGKKLFEDLAKAQQTLQNNKANVDILFLDAKDDVLVRRFESSRRPHPIQGQGRVLDGLRAERKILGELRSNAPMVVDTSEMTQPDLRAVLEKAFNVGNIEFNITILSFGFKHGVPIDSDFVFDVRFLPNPFWVDELKELTGLNEPVQDYVLGQKGATEYLRHLTEVIFLAKPGYLREGKRYLTVSIGCTGGKHRSVTFAEKISKMLAVDDNRVRTVHRDLGKK